MLLFLIALISNIFAQRQSEVVKVYDPITISKSDTLMPASFSSGMPTLYTATDGGYVAGVNSYGDLAKVQAYNFSNFSMSSVAFWFGAKEITGDADTIVLNVYEMDGTGTSAGGEVDAPGTIISSKSFTTDDIDTTGLFTIIELDEALELNGNYSVGFDMTQIEDDTFGLITTTDGDASEELAWEQWSDGAWYTLASPSGWELAVDLAIFPIGSGPASYDVTFNVDMRPAITEGDFVIGEDTVSLTGTITGWAEPVAGPDYIFADDDQDSIYTAVISVVAGDHEYKYFKNSTWSNGEWDGGDNRAITVDAEMTVNDVWGDEPVSISEAPASIDVNVYPNPSSGVIRVEAEGTNQVTVISAIGQVIISKQIENQGTINLTNNASGVYFVRVENGTKTGVRRVVIE